MKKIKSLTCNIKSSSSLYSEHSIYELDESEMDALSIQKKYLLNETYSSYAMSKPSHIGLLRDAKFRSEYIDGVTFANTVEEAELAYENAILRCRINDIEAELDKIQKSIDLIKEDIDNEIEIESK